jgi:hypothetical protein
MLGRTRRFALTSIQNDNTEMPVESVPELQVSLASIQVIPSKGASDFPTYVGDWKVYTDTTANKIGGLKSINDI